MPHSTPCTESADDRARRFLTHSTPCRNSADDRARRLSPHHTPCTYLADVRAHRLMSHRTPCIDGADDRADKRCTPCTPSDASPRARTAPWDTLLEGLSSASCPSSSTLLSASRQHRHRRYPELQSSPSDPTPSSSFLRAPHKVPSIRNHRHELIIARTLACPSLGRRAGIGSSLGHRAATASSRKGA